MEGAEIDDSVNYGPCPVYAPNDLYAFDPSVHVELEEFNDVVGGHFRQPEDGLGRDDSPSAHMWRTINWLTRYL
jgi:hypothetical protein